MSEDVKKAWQTGNNLKLNTNHLILKTRRDYTFKEINQEWGSRIFWKYVVVIIDQWPKVEKEVKRVIKAFTDDDKKDEAVDSFSETIGNLLKIIPDVLSWDNIAEMAEILLCNHEMFDGETEYKADEKGFCGAKDPFEVLNAIFFAMCVNWPSYFSPLLGEALNDSTRDSEPEQTSKEAGKN